MSDIQSIQNEIESEFGEGSLVDLSPSAFKRRNYKGVSSGSYLLNSILTGTYQVGYVYGKIYDIHGAFGSGKTTIALHFIAQCQKMGLNTAFFDLEHALDPHYASNIGVQLVGVNKLLFFQPDSGEQTFKMIYSLLDKGVKGIVIDSVAAMPTEAERDSQPGDKHISQLARLMSSELKKLVKIVNRQGAIIIFLNQIRDLIGRMVGPTTTTPGGNALKFYASGARITIGAYRMDKIASSNKLSDKTNAVKREESGVKLSVKTIKNKIAPPFQTVKLAIEFGKGIDKRVDLTRFGLLCGVVSEVTDKQFKTDIMGKSKQYNFSTAPKEIYKAIFIAAKKVYGDKFK